LRPPASFDHCRFAAPIRRRRQLHAARTAVRASASPKPTTARAVIKSGRGRPAQRRQIRLKQHRLKERRSEKDGFLSWVMIAIFCRCDGALHPPAGYGQTTRKQRWTTPSLAPWILLKNTPKGKPRTPTRHSSDAVAQGDSSVELIPAARFGHGGGGGGGSSVPGQRHLVYRRRRRHAVFDSSPWAPTNFKSRVLCARAAKTSSAHGRLSAPSSRAPRSLENIGLRSLEV